MTACLPAVSAGVVPLGAAGIVPTRLLTGGTLCWSLSAVVMVTVTSRAIVLGPIVIPATSIAGLSLLGPIVIPAAFAATAVSVVA